jgi:hypothetical protein
MPVRRVGKNCYQWGHHGKRYCGPGARQKAERQGRAAYSHGYRGREMRETMKPEVIASRRTFDNKTVQLWSDGTITWAFGQYIRGAPRKPGLDVGWAVLGEVEIVDSDDVPLLIKAAQKGGLPGEIRSRFHSMKRREENRSETPEIYLNWQTIDTDRNGKVTARVAVLPRLMYPGLAIWYERGKYEIMRKVTRSPMGYLPPRGKRGRGSNTYEPTGFSGTTLASVLIQLPELRDREARESPAAKITAADFIAEAMSEGVVRMHLSYKEAKALIYDLYNHPGYEGSSDAYEYDGGLRYDVWGSVDGREWSGAILFPDPSSG